MVRALLLLCLILTLVSCRRGGNSSTAGERSESLSFGLSGQGGCPIESLRITLEGVKEEEAVDLDRESPLAYENMECGGGIFLKFAEKRILLSEELFSDSDLALERKVVEVKDLDLTTDDIEEVTLEKSGLCIKNFETKKACKDRNRGEQCLYYDSYEEEIYRLFYLSLEANGVEIYNAELDLVFNREYELSWSDGDLMSAFWTKLHNCSE